MPRSLLPRCAGLLLAWLIAILATAQPALASSSAILASTANSADTHAWQVFAGTDRRN